MKRLLPLFLALSSTAAFAQLTPGEFNLSNRGGADFGIDYTLNSVPLAQLPENIRSVLTGLIPANARVESASAEQIVIVLPSGERLVIPYIPLLADISSYLLVDEIPIQQTDQIPCSLSLKRYIQIIPQSETQFTGDLVYAIRRNRELDAPRAIRTGGPLVTCDQFLTDLAQASTLADASEIGERLYDRYGEASLMIALLAESMLRPLIAVGAINAADLRAELNVLQVRIPFRASSSAAVLP